MTAPASIRELISRNLHALDCGTPLSCGEPRSCPSVPSKATLDVIIEALREHPLGASVPTRAIVYHEHPYALGSAAYRRGHGPEANHDHDRVDRIVVRDPDVVDVRRRR